MVPRVAAGSYAGSHPRPAVPAGRSIQSLDAMRKTYAQPAKITDPIFSRSVSLADAYRILERFLNEYNERGESSTVALISDIGLAPDGGTCDPAQLSDFLRCAEKIVGGCLGESN